MSESTPVSPGLPLSPADANLWSTLAHIGNVVTPVPPLLIFLILGPRSARVRQESREALNFGITAFLGLIALWILGGVVNAIYSALPSGIDIFFGLLGLLITLAEFAIWVVVVVFAILAAVRVNAGGSYRYPFALRLIK
jgi:uncharacterized Tic20 family protein